MVLLTVPDDVNPIAPDRDGRVFLPDRTGREAHISPPRPAMIERTFIVNLRDAVAVVVPDDVNTPIAIRRDAARKVVIEQRLTCIEGQALFSCYAPLLRNRWQQAHDN